MKTLKFLLLSAILCLHPAALSSESDNVQMKLYGNKIPCLIEVGDFAINMNHIRIIQNHYEGWDKTLSGCHLYFGNMAYPKSILTFGIDVCDGIKKQQKICLKSQIAPY